MSTFGLGSSLPLYPITVVQWAWNLSRTEQGLNSSLPLTCFTLSYSVSQKLNFSIFKIGRRKVPVAFCGITWDSTCKECGSEADIWEMLFPKDFPHFHGPLSIPSPHFSHLDSHTCLHLAPDDPFPDISHGPTPPLHQLRPLLCTLRGFLMSNPLGSEGQLSTVRLTPLSA